MEGDGEEREKRGEQELVGREKGWEGKGSGGAEKGIEKDIYTQTHRERDKRQTQRTRRERGSLPTRWSQREDAVYHSGRQQGWGEQDLGWVQERNTHAPHVHTV